MEMMEMKTCDYCGEELTGTYLKVDRSFFNEARFELSEDEAFCDEECFLEALSDAGAICDKEADDEDQ